MTQNEFPGKNPENFEKFSRFFPGPHFLTFKLFNLLIDLLRKLINEIKILCGQRWGAGKKRDAVSKVQRVFPALLNWRMITMILFFLGCVVRRRFD